LTPISQKQGGEHINARSECDVGQRELLAAQPGAAIDQLIVHLLHFLQHQLLAIGNERVVARRGEHLGGEPNIGLVLGPFSDFLA
jgi:hypothetical protein